MGLDGIRWDWMGLDGIIWDYMGLDGIGWGWIGLDGIKWEWMGLIYVFNFVCSAIVEHTNRVIYLEDDDVAAVADGNLTIHRYSLQYTGTASSTQAQLIVHRYRSQ